MKKNIVIVGGSGFVGRHLCNALSEQGHRVRVLCRFPTSAKALRMLQGVTVHGCDVYDASVLKDFFQGQDVLINLVGILNHPQESGFYRAHVELTQTLIDTAVECGLPRYLHMSALQAATEASAYLKSKCQGQRLALEAHKKGNLKTTVYQPSTIFGPDDSFINRFADLMRFLPMMATPCPKAQFKTGVYR